MEILNNYLSLAKPAFELIYYLSGLILAGCGLYALKQVSIMKKSVSIQSKRDALKLTAEQCNDYMQRIIPLQNKLDKAIESNGVTFFNGWKVEVTNTGLSVKHSGPQNTDGLKAILAHDVLNAMETFSTYFVSGVADEMLAYTTVGTTFVDSSERLMPLIIFCREYGYYKNLIELFIKWKCRQNHEELANKKAQIEEQLRSNRVDISFPIGEKIT